MTNLQNRQPCSSNPHIHTTYTLVTFWLIGLQSYLSITAISLAITMHSCFWLKSYTITLLQNNRQRQPTFEAIRRRRHRQCVVIIRNQTCNHLPRQIYLMEIQFPSFKLAVCLVLLCIRLLVTAYV